MANFTSGDFDLGPDSNQLEIKFESKLLEIVKMDFGHSPITDLLRVVNHNGQGAVLQIQKWTDHNFD